MTRTEAWNKFTGQFEHENCITTSIAPDVAILPRKAQAKHNRR